MADEASVLVIGQLTPQGQWAGVQRTRDGWEPMFGDADGSTRPVNGPPERKRLLLVVAAIAYFSEALPQAATGFEATQGDLADAMRWLAESEPDPLTATRIREAIDAVDDGLPGDAVANRLTPLMADEQADPVDLLINEALRSSRD